MKPAFVLAVCVLPACGWFVELNPRYCDETKECSDPERPFCDLNGDYEGVSNRCIGSPIDAGPTCDDSSDCIAELAPICGETSTCVPCQPGAQGDADCEDKDSVRPICAADGSCVTGCQDSDECPEAEPICSAEQICEECDHGGTGDDDCVAREPSKPWCSADGTCVECLGDGDCGGIAPICEAGTGVCRACAAHDECTSEVCDWDSGGCVDSGDIVYVDESTGLDGASCGTQLSPCATIGDVQGGLSKVEGSRQTVRVRAGSYGESVKIDGGTTVTLVGPGATISPEAGSDTPCLLVKDSSEVTIDGMTLANATGAGDADGIRCESSSSVALFRVTIADNRGIGIESSACSLTVERSRIFNNEGGGVAITAAAFSFTNSFIVGNGEAGSGGTPFGGVKIDNPSAMSPQVFEFNTVADSKAHPDAFASGVICSVFTPMKAKNNIVYAGVGENDAIASVNCSWTYSDVEGIPETDGNIDALPLFENDTAGNFHITSGSPCRDAADELATMAVDYDGDERPEGDRADMGADEFVPAGSD